RLAGRTEDEAALRDAWYLRQPGDDPGPAGTILAAWKRLASRSSHVRRFLPAGALTRRRGERRLRASKPPLGRVWRNPQTRRD
ncbi:MAG: DUF1403 family protein, partial [Mesorhizobium sp.]